MFKYVLKVASLDENLIVKQKSRFLSHILEYQESIDLAKFRLANDDANTSSKAQILTM